MTSFRSQNIAKHSVMWMIPNSFLGSLPTNFTKSSLLFMMILKKFQVGAVEIPCSSIQIKQTSVCGSPTTQEDCTCHSTIRDFIRNRNQASNCCKGLGVYINSHLNYNEHITKTVSDCIHKLTRVNRIKHLLDQKTLIFLINAFVFSESFYCSTVWRNTSKENVGKLQSVQNYACRIVAGLRKFDHI